MNLKDRDDGTLEVHQRHVGVGVDRPVDEKLLNLSVNVSAQEDLLGGRFLSGNVVVVADGRLARPVAAAPEAQIFKLEENITD